ncbi:MAG TPA: hypothetical protein VFL83_01085 [Anaeromyxobacter sp.]|nr:hypothetical protein [Anaeromyxobacter sp.]
MRRSLSAVLLLVAAGCDMTMPWASTTPPPGDGGPPPPPPSGSVTVTPASLSVDAAPGGATPAPRTLSITFTSSASPHLRVTYSGAAVANAVMGTANGWPAAIVSFPSPGASSSERSGTVTVTACFDAACTTHLQGSPAQIPVTYTVAPAPVATPASLSAEWTRGETVPTLPQVALTEEGVSAGTATPTIAYPGASGWLTATSASIPGSSSVALLPTGKPAGVHAATIRYTSATTRWVDVPVSLTIREPAVTAAPASLQFDGVIGTAPPAPKTSALTAGSVTVTYTVGVDYGAGATGWLTVPASVTPPQNVQVAPNTTALAASTHTATVRFRSADGVTRGTLDVSYTVRSVTLVDPPDRTVTVTPATVPGDLAGSAPVTVSAGPALAWTASSGAAWLVVDTQSGTTGESVAYRVDPAVLATMKHGDTKTAAITLSVASPPQSQSFDVTLENRLAEVRWVMPSVQTSGRTSRVRVRGVGFQGVADPSTLEPVEGITGAAVTRLSDTALVVDLPSAAAGGRAVRIPNALGLATPSAVLHHLDAPTFTYQKVAQAGDKRALVLDARRQAVLTVNTTQGAIVRFAHGSGTFSPSVRTIASLQDVALSPDGDLLLAVTSNEVRLLDPATLADVQILAAPAGTTYSAFSASQGLPSMNDGRVALPGRSGWTLAIPVFDLATRTFGALDSSLVPRLDMYHGPWYAASRDGERVLVVQSASISPAPPLLYLDATDGKVRTNPIGLTFFYEASLSDDGDRFILGSVNVYDGAFASIGRVALPPSTVPVGTYFNAVAALAPDGSHAYVLAYPPGYQYANPAPAKVFVVDTHAAPVSGPDLPILRSFDVPDYVSCLTGEYGCQLRPFMAVSPDDGTLFILGAQGLLVVPIPAP